MRRRKSVGYFQRWILNGWRINAATAFLRPAMRSGRVDLRGDAHTTAITIDALRGSVMRRVTAVKVARARPGKCVRDMR